jgi:[ribosomal protein S18]-alanine N-acetyltransferase
MFAWRRLRSGSNSGAMSDPISITRATRSDLDAIHRLEMTAFASPWRKEFFESELDASGRYCLAARGPGNALVGYLFAMYWSDELHINKIAVVEQERRKGIAVAMMAHCIEFARRHGVKVLSLEVRQSNVGAQEFYQRIDFRPSYKRPNYYPDGEAAVVMTRQL